MMDLYNKKNKTGFTLVELMATILILAVISTLGVGIYRSTSKKIKRQSYENKVSYIETKAANFANETGYLSTNVNYLVELGYIEPDNQKGEVINPIDNSVMNCHVVIITKDGDNFYATYTETEECNLDDIDMVNSNVEITAYEVYEDGTVGNKIINDWTKTNVKLVATFKKDVSIDQTKISKITWNSNAGAIETDKLEYIVSAEQIMNMAYRVEIMMNDGTKYEARKVVRIDKQRPILYVNEIKIENEQGYTNANKKVEIMASDQTGSGIDGYYVGTDRNCLTVSYKKSNKEIYTKDLSNGEYYVCVKDKVGNVSEDESTKKFVVKNIDTTKPTCTITPSGTISENGWYTSDVDFTIQGFDNESGVKTTELSQKKLTTDTSSFTVTGKVRDKAGNENSCSVTVKRDTKSPSCTNSGDSTTWTKQSRTIKWGCSDDGSGCVTDILGQQVYNSTIKTSTIASYTIQDTAGNTTTCPVRTANVYVDTTAPSCTNGGDSTVWTNQNRTIKWGCSDSDSGCLSGGGSKTFTTNTTTSVVGSYIIQDNAKNTTTCDARTANVYIDKTAPTCTNSGDSTTWTNQNRTIKWGCKDTGGSGCHKDYSGGSKTYNYTINSGNIGAYTIKDNAGNSTTCVARTAKIKVDKTPPTISEPYNKSASGGYHYMKLSYDLHDGDSAVNCYYFGFKNPNNENVDYNCDWNTYNLRLGAQASTGFDDGIIIAINGVPTGSVTTAPGEYDNTVYLAVKDYAGNQTITSYKYRLVYNESPNEYTRIACYHNTAGYRYGDFSRFTNHPNYDDVMTLRKNSASGEVIISSKFGWVGASGNPYDLAGVSNIYAHGIGSYVYVLYN